MPQAPAAAARRVPQAQAAAARRVDFRPGVAPVPVSSAAAAAAAGGEDGPACGNMLTAAAISLEVMVVFLSKDGEERWPGG